MAESSVFDWLCNSLESQTPLNRLEARGTVRLALKEAGLEAKTVTPDQIAVVIEKVLPDELEARAVEDGPAICRRLAQEVGQLQIEATASADSPEAVFERLGG